MEVIEWDLLFHQLEMGFANSFEYHPIIERKYTSVFVSIIGWYEKPNKNDLFSKELSEINLFYLHLYLIYEFVTYIETVIYR